MKKFFEEYGAVAIIVIMLSFLNNYSKKLCYTYIHISYIKYNIVFLIIYVCLFLIINYNTYGKIAVFAIKKKRTTYDSLCIKIIMHPLIF